MKVEHTHTQTSLSPRFCLPCCRPAQFFLFLLIVNMITKAVLDHVFYHFNGCLLTQSLSIAIHSQLRCGILQFTYKMFTLPALPYECSFPHLRYNPPPNPLTLRIQVINWSPAHHSYTEPSLLTRKCGIFSLS